MIKTKQKIGINSIKLTKKEIEILKLIFSKTTVKNFNKAVENYNIQPIYEAHRNRLVTNYFKGNILSYSNSLARLFNKFTTKDQEKKSKDISNKLFFLAKDIRNKKKYSQPHLTEVTKYNELVEKHNSLNLGFKVLRKYFIKYRTKK